VSDLVGQDGLWTQDLCENYLQLLYTALDFAGTVLPDGTHPMHPDIQVPWPMLVTWARVPDPTIQVAVCNVLSVCVSDVLWAQAWRTEVYEAVTACDASLVKEVLHAVRRAVDHLSLPCAQTASRVLAGLNTLCARAGLARSLDLGIMPIVMDVASKVKVDARVLDAIMDHGFLDLSLHVLTVPAGGSASAGASAILSRRNLLDGLDLICLCASIARSSTPPPAPASLTRFHDMLFAKNMPSILAIVLGTPALTSLPRFNIFAIVDFAQHLLFYCGFPDPFGGGLQLIGAVCALATDCPTSVTGFVCCVLRAAAKLVCEPSHVQKDIVDMLGVANVPQAVRAILASPGVFNSQQIAEALGEVSVYLPMLRI
jgi:hypothetical protein